MQRLRHAPASSRARARLWVLVAGASLVAGAYWLRAPGLRYLLVSAAAMAAAALIALALPRTARPWALAAAAFGLVFCAVAGMWQRQLWRIERDWPAHRADLVARAGQRLDERLDGALRRLRATAARALEAPSTPGEAFPFLQSLGSPEVEGGVVLYRAGRPLAWAGRLMARTDSLRSPIGATISPFYVTVYAVAARGQDRAVATALVHAEPPADRLAKALDEAVVRTTGLRAFEFLAAGPGADSGAAPPYVYRAGADTLLRAGLVAPGPDEARLYALEQARVVGALLLGIALALLIATAWRHEPRLWWRLLPLGIALVCVALLPLNAFSNVTTLFDPTVYFAEYGGAFTASVGALALASALVLLAILLVLRSRAKRAPRWAAALFALAMMVAGPFLLRALARGVSPPPGGVTTGLWLAWQLALFLASVSLLLAATAAGAAALGRLRGLPPLLAPALAAATALLGPTVVLPAGRWPEWYVVFWIVVIGALAFTRPHRGMVVTAAIVAALGATLLTWNAGLRGRIALAERDLSALTAEEPEVAAALRRLGDSLARGAPPETEAGLLRAYLRSDLSGAGYPVRLARWSTDSAQVGAVSLAQMDPPASAIVETVREAMRSGVPVLHMLSALPGTFMVLAVPHGSAGATSVVVAPRTRLIPDEPFVSLMGLDARERGEAPYVVTLVDDVDAARARGDAGTRWQREGSELHGDRTVITAAGPRRAHIELDLRSTDTVVQRGVLVVFLDLLVVLVLWLVSTLPEGALARWTRGRVQRWRRSYRARLTLALFAFFVVPALAFAGWSYRRLQSEDRQSRELLLRETLRVAAGAGGGARLAELAVAGETPFFLYRDGELEQTSDPLFAELAPAGRFLPVTVYEGLERDREVFASAQVDVGEGTALFGYRVLAGPAGEQLILAAPARGNEEALDRRRRDLGVLVLFSTVLGALAALWLSGIAARSLAEPIGRLRTAALAIAGGEREPPLDRRPPVEFEPVFAAFRRMASDLGESRAALESAQRRTAAVLRNVASGVVALGSERTVMLANPRAEALLGRALPPGAPLADVASPALASRVAAFLEAGEDEREFDLSLGERQLQARLTRLTSGGGGAVLTLDDVTEMARAQRVLAWGEMARQVAHEIKNPLTPIRLGVQHLKRARSDARPDFDAILDQNVGRILSEIDRLDEIARTFSRYGTAPAHRLPPERIDIAAVVTDAAALEGIGEGDVQWRLHGALSPVFAAARAEELREVLLNILENARLAEARHVDVRVFQRADRVTIEVTDDGVGIPAQVLPRIFEPHFSTRSSGSGLGLAMSRQVVEGWGGAVAISSEQGKGTTVRIELARAPAGVERDGSG